MAAGDAIVELASYADVRGIDWSALSSEGEGPLESSKYIDLLDERWEQFYSVSETLAITDAEWEQTSAETARQAWQEVRDHIESRAAEMLRAIGNGELTVAWEKAATVYTGSLKKLVIATSSVTHRNYAAHQDGTLLYAVRTGQTSVEDLQTDADHVAMLWSAIVKLDGWGALNEIKKPKFLSGLGQASRAAGGVLARGIPIAIAAVGIAAVIAAVIVFLAYLSERNEQIDRYCFDESGALRDDAPAWCEQAGEAITADPMSVFLSPVKATGQTLAYGVSAAVGVAAVFWLLPSVLKRWRRR